MRFCRCRDGASCPFRVRALVRLRREVPIRRALRDVSLGYAEAADERMREVGCYD